MIEVAQARALVLAEARSKSPVRVSLADALGTILAEDVVSDVDSPPHDKSLVDGYAVRSDDVAAGVDEFRVLEEVMAGDVPRQNVTYGTAIRIMTGAPIPAGADAVVMLERTELSVGTNAASRVRFVSRDVRPGQNILRRAASLARGEVVLRPRRQIRPIEIGLLAEVGCPEVLVVPRPKVAVLATGNELVSAVQRPAAGQIRNSNGPMLCALVSQAGGVATDLGIACDDRHSLKQRIAGALPCDLLILSGGVSAGLLDLVPDVLNQMGVKQVFHKVNLKPGRPIWFGVLASDNQSTLVFGLPGNPVSTLVCFELFVRPTLRLLAGYPDTGPPERKARLMHGHDQRGDRPTYWPSLLHESDGGALVEPLDWQGSADLSTLADANALAYFPAGQRAYVAGDEVDVVTL